MTLAVALLVAAGAAVGPLDQAEAAFAQGDHAAAERLALSAAVPPNAGAALYLVGLARFRDGRPLEALEALDRAGQSADAPPSGQLRYNRAACLYQLGRFAEAEAEYLSSAKLDPALAAVSLANAGFAAFDGGAPDRARSLAAQARSIGTGAAEGLIADLEAQVAAPRIESVGQPSQGGAPQPSPSGSTLPSPNAASDRRDLNATREPARNGGWQATLRLAAGYDTDAPQTGVAGSSEQLRGASAGTGSNLSTADLTVAYRFRPSDRMLIDVAYGFDQLAYLSAPQAALSQQTHGLGAAFELATLPGLRLGATVNAQLALSGLASLRAMEQSAATGLWAAFDEGERSTTRLDLGWATKGGRPGYGYLTGNRVDAGVSQELRIGPATAGLFYRFRADQIGDLEQVVPSAHQPCGGCTLRLVSPLGYASNAVWLSTRATVANRLGLDFSGGYESRNYLGDDRLQLVQRDGRTLDGISHHRQDDRWFASAAASLKLKPGLAATLRYDLVLNGSNADISRLSDEQRAFTKHVMTIGTTLSW